MLGISAQLYWFPGDSDSDRHTFIINHKFSYNNDTIIIYNMQVCASLVQWQKQRCMNNITRTHNNAMNDVIISTLCDGKCIWAHNYEWECMIQEVDRK